MAVPQPLNTERNREAVPERQTPPTDHGADAAAPMFRAAPSPHKARPVLAAPNPRCHGKAGAKGGGTVPSRRTGDAACADAAAGRRAPGCGGGPCEGQDRGHGGSLPVAVRDRPADLSPRIGGRSVPPSGADRRHTLRDPGVGPLAQFVTECLAKTRPYVPPDARKAGESDEKCRQLREVPFARRELQSTTAEEALWPRMIVSDLRKMRNLEIIVDFMQGYVA